VNRRAYVRFPCPPEGLRPTPISTGEESEHALILNVSLGGIGLLLSRRLEPFTPLRIRLQRTAHGTGESQEMSAHVAHATLREDGFWVIGCAFDRILSREELKALLA
jgi:hypothetical protein